MKCLISIQSRFNNFALLSLSFWCLVMFCGSSSQCQGFACGLWLWYFLIILTIFDLDIYPQSLCKWKRIVNAYQLYSSKARDTLFSQRWHRKWNKFFLKYAYYVEYDKLACYNRNKHHAFDLKQCILAYDVASRSEIVPCNKIIDKSLVVYRFLGNVMTSITTTIL